MTAKKIVVNMTCPCWNSSMSHRKFLVLLFAVNVGTKVPWSLAFRIPWLWEKKIGKNLGILSIITCLLCNSLSGDFEMPCRAKCCPWEWPMMKTEYFGIKWDHWRHIAYAYIIQVFAGTQALNEKATSGLFIIFPGKLFQELKIFSKTHHQGRDHPQRAQ